MFPWKTVIDAIVPIPRTTCFPTNIYNIGIGHPISALLIQHLTGVDILSILYGREKEKYKLVIRRKVTTPDGKKTEDEVVLYFDTEEEMIQAAKESKSISGVDYQRLK